jgi:hypothetical protein
MEFCLQVQLDADVLNAVLRLPPRSPARPAKRNKKFKNLVKGRFKDPF